MISKKCMCCGKVFEKPQSNSLNYWNTRKYCSKECVWKMQEGVKHTDEHKRKISNSCKKMVNSGVFKKQISDGSICSIDGCDRLVKYLTPLPICRMHYQRWWQYGTFETPWKDNNYKPRKGANGYLLITPSKKYGQIPHHRYIVEQHLGRKLNTREHVHHIDGNKKNNDISNLMVLDIAEHSKYHKSKKAKA